MFDPFLTEKQILRKLGGDKISSKVFTYDGSEDAEFDTIYGIRVTVLSTDVFDLSKITKIECTLPNGQKVAFGKSDFVFSENGGFRNVTVSLGAQSAPVVFTGSYGGLFGYAQPGFGYCSYVEFAETIVPIDQKYLPGVCLPVVEISGDIDMENLRIPCTVTESAALDAAVEAGMPVVLKLSALGSSAVATFGDGGYIFSFNGMTIACRLSDEEWFVFLEQN